VRNEAFAVVGLIQSASTRQEIAVEQYEVLYQELVEALEKFKRQLAGSRHAGSGIRLRAEGDAHAAIE